MYDKSFLFELIFRKEVLVWIVFLVDLFTFDVVSFQIAVCFITFIVCFLRVPQLLDVVKLLANLVFGQP